MLDRLHATVAAAAPIVGVSKERSGVRIDFAESATPSQKAAAQAVADAFDWSQAAHDVWFESLNPEARDLRQGADRDISENDAFLALPRSEAQQMPALLDHIRRLTMQVNKNTKVLKKRI